MGIAASTQSGVGSGSANVITNLIESRITGSSVTLTGVGEAVKLTALDTATITADGGGVGLALAFGQGGGTALTAAVSLAINHVADQVQAVVEDSTVTVSGNVELSATSTATIHALTIAGTVGAAGGQGGGFSFAGAGSGSGNTVRNTVKAEILDGSAIKTTGAGVVTLTATDTSKIIADAGGVGIAIAGGQGGGAAVTAGVSIAHNDIQNEVSATVSSSTIIAAGNVGLTATSTATIDAWTLAVAVGAAGGQGGGFSFAGAGSGSGNTIQNTVKAEILHGSTVTTTDAGSVTLSATDTSKIIADAGGVGVALAGGEGGGASISAGISIAENELGNVVQAVVDHSTVTSAADVQLSATSSGTIDALTWGGAASLSGGAGGGLSAAGSGAEASNWIHNDVVAAIQNGSSVTTASAGAVNVTATDYAHITADAAGGSVSIAAGAGGAGAISIGAAVADNDISSLVEARINNATISAAGDVKVEATSTSTIDAFSIAVSISFGVSPVGLSFSGAGAESTNDTTSQILASIGNNSSVTAAGNVGVCTTDDSTAIADVGSGALSVGVVVLRWVSHFPTIRSIIRS